MKKWFLIIVNGFIVICIVAYFILGYFILFVPVRDSLELANRHLTLGYMGCFKLLLLYIRFKLKKIQQKKTEEHIKKE